MYSMYRVSGGTEKKVALSGGYCADTGQVLRFRLSFFEACYVVDFYMVKTMLALLGL